MDSEQIRAYYNEFAERYEAERRPHRSNGYHALIDDLEVELVERYGIGKDILECGCGTGLLLERFATVAKSATGIDLSPGMLKLATDRGLNAQVGSVTDLPFPDESFDVTCSFKVLAHVPEIGRALAEMARVTRRGGIVLAEFYNPISLRAAVKRFGPAGNISATTKEDAVYTRFDPPWRIPKLLPPTLRNEGAYGIRIVTPTAAIFRVPGVSAILGPIERALASTPLSAFGGFYVAILRRQ